MVTKTDYRAVEELHRVYTPDNQTNLTEREVALVQSTLELNTRSDIEVENVREMAYLMYDRWARVCQEGRDMAGFSRVMDEMCAVCAIIDKEREKRGTIS